MKKRFKVTRGGAIYDTALGAEVCRVSVQQLTPHDAARAADLIAAALEAAYPLKPTAK